MESPIDMMSHTSINSVTTQKMEDDDVDTFTPPLNHFSSKVKQSLDELLDSFNSPICNDKTSIGMTNLADMQIDTGNSEPVSQKSYMKLTNS